MKKLYINNGEFDTVFNDLKDSFNGTLSAQNNEYNLDIQSKWTKGSIKGNRFDDKILFMHFDLVFHQDVSLSIEAFQSAPVFFVYCENGKVCHSFGANGEKKIVGKNQSAVLNNSSVINSVLYFESHKRIQFTLLGMPTVENRNTPLVSQVKQHFTNDSGNYIYIGKENARISKKIQQYKTMPEKGIVGTLLKKSILNHIVEMEVEQHAFNYLKTFDPIVDIVVRQIAEIKRISAMSFSEVFTSFKLFRAKHHWSFKLYNQKLAS
ncbi:hypothetical protein [Flavobacterium sp. 245]|uniref:hypothetical protein n=1 Tax=Flavobacterium sp. 245 TaxID=2512115 RepID=UPI00105E2326|nr:hypothetical protein [Flavobacterium sp. 245]TDP03338.1 hypothetical protein EV145_102502 [Flavobacterium sp. 245]